MKHCINRRVSSDKQLLQMGILELYYLCLLDPKLFDCNMNTQTKRNKRLDMSVFPTYDLWMTRWNDPLLWLGLYSYNIYMSYICYQLFLVISYYHHIFFNGKHLYFSPKNGQRCDRSYFLTTSFKVWFIRHKTYLKYSKMNLYPLNLKLSNQVHLCSLSWSLKVFTPLIWSRNYLWLSVNWIFIQEDILHVWKKLFSFRTLYFFNFLYFSDTWFLHFLWFWDT